VDNDADESGDEAGHLSADGTFTRNDLTFLRSLRITTEEHESAAGSSDPGA
jgi:hypothetical protein